MLGKALLTSALITLPAFAQAEVEIAGKLGVDARYFFDEGAYANQLKNQQFSAYFEPEFYWSWQDGQSSLLVKPYARIDSEDDERTHVDLREFSYIYASENWEVRAGIRKVFWGVTEFQHLVDVINQTDAVEDVDGEDKLGQAMINLSIVNDWGIVDLYLLPGFRERTFAGEKGRLRAPVVVDTDKVSYQSSAEDKHLDFALRWSHSVGNFDLGSYWFHGTNRDPLLTLNQTEAGMSLTPYYEQMDQLGFDVQATIDSWLWKFEAIYRDSDFDQYVASQAGVEYSFYGIADSAIDLGVLLEYGWDSRGKSTATHTGGQFQNDLFVGARLAFNDVQSTEILAGFGTDLDHNSTSVIMEASRRFGDNIKLSLDVRLFSSYEPYDVVSSVEQDDHFQLSVERYF